MLFHYLYVLKLITNINSIILTSIIIIILIFYEHMYTMVEYVLIENYRNILK